ncbi:hypothetical protein AB9K26_12035 [Psychroserpens sp. XS_ASV72]|uniref:hypothetical protein n=1 Tax=Psychroserpens sp. XS_ASV72 TaxID=3241293 RepID=UPI003514C041
MKKKLESELISIAHRILKLKGKEDVAKMHAEVAVLYEKLSVLKFANENFEGDLPTIGSNSSFFGMLDTAFNNKVSDNIEIEDRIYINLDEKEDDQIYEPVMQKIKDMVAQMPEDESKGDQVVKATITRENPKETHIEDITAGFEEIPEFEPVSEANKRTSLNDKLKTGTLNIGLNDKLAYIKHLFNGQSEDYDRVVSQLNTTQTFDDAKRFINDIVKPDYNDWSGKEDLESRFLEAVERKFA